MPIIDVRNLSKTFTTYRKEPGLLGTLKSFVKRHEVKKEAVKNVSFEIEAGELVGFLGPNGAGKTTTIKMLTGIVTPTSGDLTVLSHEPARREPDLQRNFGLVMGQKNQLFKDLPAYESLILMGHIYDMSDAETKDSMDELVNILDAKDFLNVPMRSLSLGQRMKCELIGALIHRPKILFLDEPTIGLDVVAQKGIRDFIKKVNQERGTTIMLTSHYMKDIEELCKRVIVINLGEIMYDGLLTDLINRHADKNAPIDEIVRHLYSKA
jgi:ABC-2 type transport system ATP-binding protein